MVTKRRLVFLFGLIVAAVSAVPVPVAAAVGEADVAASSQLGGSGDSVCGVRIQSDGVLVLAANLSTGPVVTQAGKGDSKGIILRLSADGGKVLSALRVSGEVRDLAIDGKDNIYVAAGSAGAIKLDSAGAKVLWKKDTGGLCARIDAAADGRCAALRYDKDDESAPGAGVVYVLDPDGHEVSNFKGRPNTLDVAVDGVSQTVITIGWRQANAFDGKKKQPVQISHLIGRGYDGAEKYHLYDWSVNPDAPEFINKPENNMADTRGYRCAIGADGKLYCAFEAAGGNHIFRYEPRLDGGRWVAAQGKKPKGDSYHHFANSRAEHKSFFARFEPGTGNYLLGQEFTARLKNGRANAVRVKNGAIAGGPDGSVYLGGTSAADLPVTFAPPGTGDYKGGGFILGMPPQFDRRTFCIRLQAGAIVRAVDVRKVGERTILVCGGTTSGKQDGFWSKNALQEKAPPSSGFFCVLALQ